jgi:N-acetylneuraminic acid mutarotase
MPRRSRVLVAPVVAFALVAAACSGGGSSGSSKSTSTTAKPGSSRSSTPSVPGSTVTRGATAGINATPASWKLPAPRARAVALTEGNVVFVLGGLDGSKQSTATILRIDPATGYGATAGGLLHAVHDAAGAKIGISFVVFGGGAAGDTQSAAVQAYTPERNTKDIGMLPEPRSDQVAASVRDTAYVLAGFNGKTFTPDVLATADGLNFDVVGKLAEPVRYPAVAVADGAIYVFGGATGGVDTRSVQRFDPATRKTTIVGQLPQPWSHASAVTIGGAIYVLGGFANNTVTAQILRFDVKTHAVQPVGALPAPVSDAAVVTVGDTSYLIGGQGSNRATLSSVVAITGK